MNLILYLHHKKSSAITGVVLASSSRKKVYLKFVSNYHQYLWTKRSSFIDFFKFPKRLYLTMPPNACFVSDGKIRELQVDHFEILASASRYKYCLLHSINRLSSWKLVLYIFVNRSFSMKLNCNWILQLEACNWRSIIGMTWKGMASVLAEIFKKAVLQTP